MTQPLHSHVEDALHLVEKGEFVGPLLARVVVGAAFVGTGWGKLHSLDKLTEFFVSLHIPAPHFQAGLVASVEFSGGLALIFGLLTRLAAIPLAVTMVVAIITAKLPNAEGFFDVVGFEELTYLVVFTWLVFAGPGRASLDHLLYKRFVKTEPAARTM
ncbi:MAG: DoxX family protein [Polyangia bacterium]